MSDQSGSDSTPGTPATGDSGATVRYDITIDAGSGGPGDRGPSIGPAVVDRFDLDRLPNRGGSVRALVTEEELATLRSAGVPVEVGDQIDVAPLDRSLLVSDDEAQAWLQKRLHGIPTERKAP